MYIQSEHFYLVIKIKQSESIERELCIENDAFTT